MDLPDSSRSSSTSPGLPTPRMHIIIVTDYLPPQTHGIAQRVAHHVDHFRALGHKVTLLGPRGALWHNNTLPLSAIKEAIKNAPPSPSSSSSASLSRIISATGITARRQSLLPTQVTPTVPLPWFPNPWNRDVTFCFPSPRSIYALIRIAWLRWWYRRRLPATSLPAPTSSSLASPTSSTLRITKTESSNSSTDSPSSDAKSDDGSIEAEANLHTVVWLVGPSICGSFFLTIARLLCLPIVYSLHVDIEKYNDFYSTNPLLHYILYHGGTFLLYYAARHWADGLMAPSRWMPAGSKRSLGSRPHYAMQSGYDTRFFSIDRGVAEPPRGRHLLYVGRLAPEKNIDVLLRYFAHSFFEERQVVMYVVGFGPMHEELVRLTQELKMDHRVKFLGKVEHAKLGPVYRQALATVTASLSETFGLTLLEGTACGAPPLYPKVEPFWSEYEHSFGDLAFNLELSGKGSRVPSTKSVDEFVEVVRKLLDSDPEALVQRCRDHVKNKTWEAASKELLRHFATIGVPRNI